MTELALVSVLHSRRKSNSYVLAGDDTQAGYVWNECWLDADLADSNWAGSKLSKNMGWFRRNEGNDPVRETASSLLSCIGALLSGSTPEGTSTETIAPNASLMAATAFLA